MPETTMPIKRAISEIVWAYRQLQGKPHRPLSFRGFAAALSQVLAPLGGNVSHQTVNNWENCTHLPNYFAMMQISRHAPEDWRADFAQDVLAALKPELFKPATAVGNEAINRGRAKGEQAREK